MKKEILAVFLWRMAVLSAWAQESVTPVRVA
jgi:hypothetical protein